MTVAAFPLFCRRFPTLNTHKNKIYKNQLIKCLLFETHIQVIVSVSRQ
ncbi:hypothetical protein ymoll0001_29690 [Yersinia mollaretii ATCC 43969]|uniref:Uncharacterized protein n=1 Tax=Yersinia mollaretii (strain ATCC 43969 / DSM 18520 / CIP 103324 / CNY 7263 / WAIP 204) TaxID=349967 RepID=A0ABM9YBQ5_YERMW|nr:hypothetical protein ymoll0001_29690 [Yersinia mollaretii ATCC 43969]